MTFTLVGQGLKIIVVCLLAPSLSLCFRRKGELLIFNLALTRQVCTWLWSLLGPAVPEHKSTEVWPPAAEHLPQRTGEQARAGDGGREDEKEPQGAGNANTCLLRPVLVGLSHQVGPQP